MRNCATALATSDVLYMSLCKFFFSFIVLMGFFFFFGMGEGGDARLTTDKDIQA